MPELLTRHPEVTLSVLKGANIRCGVGDKQTILTSCPKNDFCRLPTGELCIYGIKELPNMTQLSVIDLITVPSFFMQFFVLLTIIFLGGVLLGIKLGKPKRG